MATTRPLKLRDWRAEPADGSATRSQLADAYRNRAAFRNLAATRVRWQPDADAYALEHHGHPLVTAHADGSVTVNPFPSVTSAARVRRFSPVHVAWSDTGAHVGHAFHFAWQGVAYVTSGPFTLNADGTVDGATPVADARAARTAARAAGRRTARELRAVLERLGGTSVEVATTVEGTADVYVDASWSDGPSVYAVLAELGCAAPSSRTPDGVVVLATRSAGWSVGAAAYVAHDLGGAPWSVYRDVLNGTTPCPPEWLADPRAVSLAAVAAELGHRPAYVLDTLAAAGAERVHPADAAHVGALVRQGVDLADAVTVVAA